MKLKDKNNRILKIAGPNISFNEFSWAHYFLLYKQIFTRIPQFSSKKNPIPRQFKIK